MGRRTGIFTKRPEPGRVKTRLIPCLGAERAAELAEAMLADTVRRLTAEPGLDARIVFAPAEAEPWFRERFPGVPLEPQTGEGLGARLAAHFERTLTEEGVSGQVVVGSDQPLVTAARVAEAHAALERGADLVLGPDRGGGYYLVGLRASRPELFLEVPMSTRGMFRETLELAGRRDLRIEVLPPSVDVDVEEDLLHLRAELRRLAREGRADDPDFPRETHAYLQRLETAG